MKITKVCFQLAGLYTKGADDVPTKEEVEKVKERFRAFLSYFTQNNLIGDAGHVKNGKELLPYNSMTVIGELHNYLILHFTTSFGEPLFFVINTNTEMVMDYLKFDKAKVVLDDDIFEDMMIDLKEGRHKQFDRMFKGVNDFNKFVSLYKDKLDKHVQNTSEYECFEISIKDLDETKNM